MWRSPRNRILFVSMLSSVAVAAAAEDAAAQVEASTNRASIEVGARLIVPVRMIIESAGESRLVGRNGNDVEIEVLLRAAANLDWMVTVRLPSGESSRGAIFVQRQDGSWVEIAVGSDVAVTTPRAASNPTAVAVRVRVPADAQESIRRLVFGIVRAE